MPDTNEKGPSRRVRSAWLVPFLLFNLLDASDTSAETVLSMETAIDRALSHNSQIRAGAFAVQKARWDKRHAWTQFLPTLSFGARMARIDDRTLSERDFRSYLPPDLATQVHQTVFKTSYYSALDLFLPLFNSALLNGLSMAGASGRMAVRMDRSTRQQTIFEVISGFLNILKARDILELQWDYLELSRLNFEKANRLHGAGRYSKTDVLRWQKEQGLISNIAFIDAKLSLQNAKLNGIAVHYDLISAVVEMAYLLGKIDAWIDSSG